MEVLRILASADVETYTKKNGKYYPELNCQKFTIGCLRTERKNKSEFFYKKEDMWNRIIELGKKEHKRGKTLNLYCHNMAYDFFSFANIKSKNIKYYSNKPFIASYEENGKQIIKFLDSHGIFRMPLEKLGKKLNTKKLTMPEVITKKEQLKEYVEQDTKIVLESILWLKKLLKETNTPIRRIYTINQIAISYMLKEIKKHKKEDKENFFWFEDKNETRRTFWAEEIHGAYRGGRVEAFHTGTFHDVTYIDCNSLYPYIAQNMKFPNLKSERKHEKPDYKEFYEHLQKIGISKVLIENENCHHKLLPIRTKTSSYYPKTGKRFIGTYTHEELKLALEEGYNILAVEWSITYEEQKNLLTTPIKKIYKQRKNSTDEMEKYLWKSIMNCSFGKLGQKRTGQKLFIESIEKAVEYLNKNYKMIKGIRGTTDILYKEKNKNEETKPYYTPIIPTLINAGARCYMYKHIKKVPLKDLIYTDTDSIIFIGDHLNKFPISNELGDFKIESIEDDIIVYGKKTYMIGNEAKISGFRKRDITRKEFKNGKVTNKKMNTIWTTNNIKEIGTFTEETRNLKQQLKEHLEEQKMMEEPNIYIDNDITDINYFLKTKSLNT